MEECLSLIEVKLKELGLKLNSKTSIQPLSNGIIFLKWKFVLTDSGKILMLADPQKITKEKRRIRKLLEKEKDGKIPEGTAKKSLDCWLANIKRGNTYKIQNDMINYFNERNSHG